MLWTALSSTPTCYRITCCKIRSCETILNEIRCENRDAFISMKLHCKRLNKRHERRCLVLHQIVICLTMMP